MVSEAKSTAPDRPQWAWIFSIALLFVLLPIFAWYLFYASRQVAYFEDRSIRLLGVAAQGLANAIQSEASTIAVKEGACVSDTQSASTHAVGVELTRSGPNGVLVFSRGADTTAPSTDEPATARCKAGDSASGIATQPRSLTVATAVDWNLLEERFDDVWIVAEPGPANVADQTKQPAVLLQLNPAARPAPEQFAFKSNESAKGDSYLPSVRDSFLPKDAKRIETWGEEYLAFSFPLFLPETFEAGGVAVALQKTKKLEGRLALYGVVSKQRFTRDALTLSYQSLLLFSGAVLFAFLAVPYVKVRFMARRERLRFVDMWLLGFSGFAIAQLTTLAVAGFAWQSALSQRLDQALAAFAGTISEHVTSEMSAARKQLDLSAVELMQPEPGACAGNALQSHDMDTYPFIDVVFYTNATGAQAAKWLAKPNTTPCVSIGKEAYFRAAMNLVGNESEDAAAFQSIDAPTTGKQLAVIARPIARSASGSEPKIGPDVAMSSRDGVAVLAAPLLSLVNPVTPYPLEYVVLDSAGAVLFRSGAFRNMREKFLAEIDHASRDQAEMLRATNAWLSARYLGRMHRMYFTPLRLPGAEPMTIVTFYDHAIVDTLLFEGIIACLLWAAGAVLLVALAVVLARVAFGRWFGDWMWPTERRTDAYVVGTAVLLVFLVVVAAVGGFAPAPLAALLLVFLPPVLLFGVSLPWVHRAARRVIEGSKGSAKERARKKTLLALPPAVSAKAAFWYPHTYVFFVVVLLIVTAVLPAAFIAQKTFDSYVDAFSRAGERSMATALERRRDSVNAVYTSKPATNTATFNEQIGVDKTKLEQLKCARLATNWDVYSPTFAVSQQPKQPVAAYQTNATWKNGACGYLETATTHENSPIPRQIGRCGMRSREDHWPEAESIFPLLAAACLPPAGPSALEMRGSLFTEEPKAPGKPDAPSQKHWVAAASGALWAIPNARNVRLWDLGALQLALKIVFPAVLLLLLACAAVRSVGRDILGLELEGDGILDRSAALKSALAARKADAGAATRWLVLRPNATVRGAIVGDEKPLDLSDAAIKDAAASAAALDSAVVVSAVEARLTDKNWRDELVRRMSAGDGRSLILVSEIDPMYWLQGRQATIDTASTEIIGWANALARFKKARFKIPDELENEIRTKLSPANASVQTPDGARPKASEKSPREKRALKIVLSECRWTDELAEIGKALDLDVLAKLSQAQIIEHILDEAEAYYRKIWSLCSEEEKLVLIQLAEEGLVNPRHFDVLRRLRRRRLVRTDGHIRLLNCSFEQFVREAENPTVVAAWEYPAGGAGSARVRVPLLVLATVATVLLLFTQQQLFDTMTGVMAAVLGATGALGSLATRFRNPFSKSPQQ